MVTGAFAHLQAVVCFDLAADTEESVALTAIVGL